MTKRALRNSAGSDRRQQSRPAPWINASIHPPGRSETSRSVAHVLSEASNGLQ